MPSGKLVGIGVAALFALAGGSSPAAAATSSPGQLDAFGYNGFGQLGNTTNDENEQANPTPTLVTLPGAVGPVTQIAAGHLHSLVLTSTGQLYAFGNNFYGQLGRETEGGIEEPNPTPTLVTLPGASGPATQVAAGSEHSLALTSTGQLYAFGDNERGQLGSAINSGTETANPTPTLVTLPGAGGPVTEIAAGGSHSLALTSTGQLYAFGDNDYGQLGNASNDQKEGPNPTPTLVEVPGATGEVSQIAAGSEHSLALTSTGQLYAFGWNGYGQLGIETNSNTANPNPTPTLVTLPGAPGPVRKIAAGGNHSLALTSTGQLYAFGDNERGQLGSETNSGNGEANPKPTLVDLPGAIGSVAQIAAGRQDSLAVTSTGQLYAFGDNRFGQLGSELGNGTGDANPMPALVALPGTTVDTVARGADALHTLALIADLAVTSASLPAGQAGVTYTATAQASGGTTPYTWTAGGLPAGLAIDPASGQITGTPTTPGTANVVLTVTDAFGISAGSAAIALTVNQAKALSPGTTICNGVYTGTGRGVMVPPGAVCTLLGDTEVRHDVRVDRGGTLVDRGATIDHDLSADGPQGIAVAGGSVGHDVQINGLTGAAPNGDNHLCNVSVAHDLSVRHGAVTAGRLDIGDPPECKAGNRVGHDLIVQNNAEPVDVSDNGTAASPIGHDLIVQRNQPGGATVSGNYAARNATCRHNLPQTGAGNHAAHDNSCPP